MNEQLQQALLIAKTADVYTPESSVVLYSISYQSSDINKRKAMEFLQKNSDKMTLDDTECGKKLMALGLETGNENPDAELLKIWAIASERFIKAAKGNVVAFVDNADKRSTFVTVELPLILQNKNIITINGKNKEQFVKEITIK
ncbi:MAG: hypothetical protein IJ677_02210 [Alphaproteobacteria bacterium]|nr:hypothetical protein [Alphaproteobacteria bacterium]